MKKAVRIIAWILALFILLQVAVVVVLQSSRVQTFLGRFAIDKLQDKMDADITFGSASIRPFDALLLEDLLVKDRAPVVEGMDTLLYVHHVSARFSLVGLLTGESIHVKRAKVDGGCFHLSIEDDPVRPEKTRTNLQRVFRMKTPEGDPEMHWGDLLRARSVEVNNVHFWMENLGSAARMAEKGIILGEGVIDWNHLNVKVLSAHINGVRMQEDLITGSVDDLTVLETDTGLLLGRLEAKKVRVGKGNAHVENITGPLGANTYLNISRLDMDGKLDIYEDFINRVRMDITLREGTYVSMQDVSHFAPNLDQMGFSGRIKGRLQGTVSDFHLSDFVVDGLNDDIHVKASGSMTGLPEIETTALDFQVNELTFGMADLAGFVKDWAHQVDLSSFRKMAPGEDFTIAGHVGGFLNDMTFEGDITSRLGTAKADLYMRNAIDLDLPIVIGGHLDTDNLDIGRILGVKELGDLTLTTRVEGIFPNNGSMQVQLDTLHIHKLGALGYNYSGIAASGYYKGTDFDLSLSSTDPNLLLNARGLYHEDAARDGYLNVEASLPHANLEALHLDKRGKSIVDGLSLEALVERKEAHALGQISATGLKLENDSGRYAIPDINLTIDQADTLHLVNIESGMLDAWFTGSRSITDFISDIKTLVLDNELSALTEEPASRFSGAVYSASAQIKDTRNLFAFLTPGLYIENGTRLDMDITPGGILTADLSSGRVAMNGNFLKDMKLHADNRQEALSGELTSSLITLSGAHLNNNRLTFQADDNQVGLGYIFDNEAETETSAKINLSALLGRGAKGLEVKGRALPSNIFYKGNGWSLSSGDVFYTQGQLQVDSLLAHHEDQQLLVDGGYFPGHTDTLTVTMDRFDIDLFNTILGDRIPVIEGTATGRATLLSSASSSPGLLAGIVCDSTRIDGKRLGQLQLRSIWDEANNRFAAHLSTQLDHRQSLQARAYLKPATKDVQLEMLLDRFDMGYAHYFLNTIFHEFSGDLSGKVILGGQMGNLHLDSEDLKVENGRLTLDFTRVPYDINGKLALNDKGLQFKQVDVTDGEGGMGTVTGGILFTLKDLENMRLDTHVIMREMRAIALQQGENPLAFGNVYASGKVDVTGPLNNVTVYVDASSAKTGEFHLPIGSSSSDGSTELLTFTEAESSEDADPYEEMMASQEQTRIKQSNFVFKARLKVAPDLKAYIDIGEENSLNATGSGTIEIDSNNNGFNLGGDYNIRNGSFHFSVLNLVTRDFTIQEGSTIRFNGDVMDTNLDVTGVYVTKANLGNLLPSDSSISGNNSGAGRRTVNCLINITGKLSNPEVHFDIEVPDLSPVMQGQVNTALNSEDKIQKQFVYLLIAGNFLPTEESGVTTNGSDVLFSNVSSIMSGQINNIFQKLDIPLDLGLNYQTTQAGKNLFDVAVSTQLFNNRVIVNGTVGNKQLAGGATTNEIAGDVDIEIKLNRSGSLRLSLFSHSADQYTYYLDNSQRNGGGIAYQREFNSFRQFFRELFASKKKREEMELEASTHPVESVVLEIDSNGKSTVANEVR